jgi:hypothetical protein
VLWAQRFLKLYKRKQKISPPRDPLLHQPINRLKVELPPQDSFSFILDVLYYPPIVIGILKRGEAPLPFLRSRRRYYYSE